MSTLTETPHVQFKLDQEELKSHHEQVEINQLDEHQYAVNLGYLKIDHYYLFSFDLHYVAESFVYLNDQSSNYIKFKGLLKKSENLHTMTFVCYTHKEKHEQDNVHFEALRKNPDTGMLNIVIR